ncbi:bifunctional RNase H/acid phosphatase [compost metagenome]
MARGETTSCSQSIQRLLAKLGHLSPQSRRVAWAAYRICRRFARPRISEEHVLHTALQLARRVRDGAPYAAITLGLKLAQAYTRHLLRRAGRAARPARAHAQEGYHLLRQSVRALLGFRCAEEHPRILFGSPCSWPLVQAWSDGSVRDGHAAAAVVVQAPAGNVLAERGCALGRASVLAAELAAAMLALRLLHARGIRCARLNVDSLGVLRAFEGRLALKYCVEEAMLLQLAQEFDTLEVRLVPRTFNAQADALAAAALPATSAAGVRSA